MSSAGPPIEVGREKKYPGVRGETIRGSVEMFEPIDALRNLNEKRGELGGGADHSQNHRRQTTQHPKNAISPGSGDRRQSNQNATPCDDARLELGFRMPGQLKYDCGQTAPGESSQ